MPDDKALGDARLWCEEARRLLGLAPLGVPSDGIGAEGGGDGGGKGGGDWDDLDAGGAVTEATRTRVKTLQSKLDNLPPPAGEVEDVFTIANSDVTYARQSTPAMRDLFTDLKGIDKAELDKMPEATQKRLKDLQKQLDEYFGCNDLGKEFKTPKGKKKEGHGPQKHEGQITEQQLSDRTVKGLDPLTGKSTVIKKGKKKGQILKPDHATAFNSPHDFINAEQTVRSSERFKNAPVAGNKKKAELTLEEVFGKDYKDTVRGKTRVDDPDPKIPPTAKDTDFTDGTVVAIYLKGDDGAWNLLTMYPKPK